MGNVVFREAPQKSEPVTMAKDLPKQPKDNTKVENEISDKEPIELSGRNLVLEALNISDDINNLPTEDKGNVQEVKNYVEEIIKAKGLSPTIGVFKKTLEGLKSEMGLSDEAEPSIILDRIAGVIKAWRNLSFIKDTEEKQRIFIKLAALPSSVAMNKEVLRLMEKYEIWQ